jgi:ABC-2 type transport system ATP-binding protein
MNEPALTLEGVSFRYGDRQALDDVSFAVQPGEIFGLLGPNGGGKTTLFRILSTTLPVQQGQVSLLGCNVATQPDAVREVIGVTFQSPSLDPKLTVGENLTYQGHLYGLRGAPLRQRAAELLQKLGLSDRVGDIAQMLSGGLKRRVEIAKSLLHQPRILLLDEPSTGLDPGARHDLWRYLRSLRDEGGVTVLVTTHLMEEAERCDRLGILDKGRLVAQGTPDELRASVGGDTVTVEPAQASSDLSARIRERFGVDVRVLASSLRIERENGHELVRDLVAAFPEDIKAVSFGKPTLEDVFIQRTGHRFWNEEPGDRA